VPVVSRPALVPGGPAWLAHRDRTLAEYAPVFLKWLGFVRQRRENTVLAYGQDLETFLGFCAQAGLSRPDDVSFRHLEFYLGWLQTERGLKASSANRHVHALRTFWTWMVREEITTRNPAAQVFLLPTRKTLPGYLSIAEQEQLLEALAQDTSPLGVRDYALVATGLLTGLRCAELSHLQLGHLNLDAGVLRVVDGKGRKDRELPIIPRLERILRPRARPAGAPGGSERLRVPSGLAASGMDQEVWRRPGWTEDDLLHDPAPLRGGAPPAGPPPHAPAQLRLPPARERG
jgi:integrase